MNWFKVEDKLPELKHYGGTTSDRILICYEYDGKLIVDKGVMYDFGWMDSDLDHVYPTHWMPLPEPPKD